MVGTLNYDKYHKKSLILAKRIIVNNKIIYDFIAVSNNHLK